MSFELAAATLASFLAAIVNSIAGGGGLVSLPILLALFPSAPPATIFGTNKSAMVWGTLWASATYARHVTLPWRMLAPAVVAALAGGAIGAWTVTRMPSDWIRHLVPWMLAIVLVATLSRSDLGSTHAPRLRPFDEAVVGSLLALGLGLYDGFFGPGTGSFFIFAFVRLLGFDFLHAAACAKVLNTATNLGSLATFALTGNVWWQFMLPMAVANVLGSMVGAKLAIRHGSGFVRIVFLAVVGALVLKTGFDALVR